MSSVSLLGFLVPYVLSLPLLRLFEDGVLAGAPLFPAILKGFGNGIGRFGSWGAGGTGGAGGAGGATPLPADPPLIRGPLPLAGVPPFPLPLPPGDTPRPLPLGVPAFPRPHPRPAPLPPLFTLPRLGVVFVRTICE